MGDPNAARFPTMSSAAVSTNKASKTQKYAAWVGFDFCTNREGCVYGGLFKALASARSLHERSVLKNFRPGTVADI